MTLRSALHVPDAMAGAALEGDGLACEAVKPADDGEWIVLRCRNVTATEQRGTWSLGVPVTTAQLARLDETPTGDIVVADGRIEFTGENELEHTPRNELIRVKTGDAFDVVGERVRVNFNGSNRQDFAEEDFEIRVRNRKTEPVTVRVVEHLYRWSNWSITAKSRDFVKKDAQTIEFEVAVPPDAEKVVTYRVRYEWR